MIIIIMMMIIIMITIIVITIITITIYIPPLDGSGALSNGPVQGIAILEQM